MTRDASHHAPEHPADLRVQFTTTEDGTVELTLSPPAPSAAEATTVWLTATEGSFMDLSELR